MRVVVDATSMPASRAGVAHYLLALIGALDQLAEEEEVDLLVVTKSSDAVELSDRAKHAEIVISAGASRFGRPGRLAWEQTGLPLLLRRLKPDLLHAPHYSLPYATRVPTVVVLHDATFFTMPGAHEPAKIAWFRGTIRLSARRASRIISVSEFSKNDLCRILRIPDDKVDVVYHGVDAAWFKAIDDDQIASARRAHKIGRGDYVFYVGTLEPRKNVDRLVAAYDIAVAKGLDARLVLAGAPGWKMEAIERAISSSPNREKISRLGYVSEGDKRALMGGASAFAYPSLSEGFGIPVLEAMAAGIPVVTSDISATAEVAGEAALTANPLDTAAVAAALTTAVTDEAERERLQASGRRRAKKFTWERAARSTIESWRRVAR